MPENKESNRNKILELFHYRQLPWLLEYAELADRDKLFDSLLTLQEAIYALDHQLETNWDIGLSDLKPYWIEIYRNLDLIGLSPNQQRTWTVEIVRYQSRELDLRSGRSPLKYSLEDLYCFKSCDVRLMRRIIYWRNPALNQQLKFSEWTEFDLITEVNDDIEDIFEDLQSLNANRFLFSLAELGFSETAARYEQFIKAQVDKFQSKMHSSTSTMKEQMSIWIGEVAGATIELLLRNLTSLDKDQIDKASVIRHYNLAKLTSA